MDLIQQFFSTVYNVPELIRTVGFYGLIAIVFAETGLLIGGILLVLGVALGLTNYLIDAQAPDLLAAWAEQHVPSRWLFLLGLNVVLVVVGGIVEIYAAIVVVVPLLLPVGLRLGLDPQIFKFGEHRIKLCI